MEIESISPDANGLLPATVFRDAASRAAAGPDLLYHLLVLTAECGIGLNNVRRELAARAGSLDYGPSAQTREE